MADISTHVIAQLAWPEPLLCLLAVKEHALYSYKWAITYGNSKSSTFCLNAWGTY